jgi:Family of unknown function (DUF5670)
MLYTVAVILLITWLLGLVGTFTIGPIIRLLLVVAFVLFVVGSLGQSALRSSTLLGSHARL